MGWAYLNFLEVLNLLRPVAAIDSLSHLGERTLVFENDNPLDPVKNAQLTFPKGRSTIFHDGTLYDWYGRKVAIPSQIKRIIKPFGYNVSQPHDILNYRDTFLVELHNGKFAIVGLYYRPSDCQKPSYTGGKLRVTGRTLDGTPYLRFDGTTTHDESTITYDSINFDFVRNTFLSDLQHDESHPLAAVAQIANSSQCAFLSSISYTQRDKDNGFFIHHIVPSKSALLEFFQNPAHQSSSKPAHPPTIFTTTTFCDDAYIYEGERKITAHFCSCHSHSYRASLDYESLAYRQGNHLYWYQE